MIQRLATIASALGVFTFAISSVMEFLNEVEKHRIRTVSPRNQLQSTQNYSMIVPSMNTVDSTSVSSTASVFPKKSGHCRICDKRGYTEWHHIISQHHARKTKQFPLLRNPGNIVELCKTCHNQTSASKSRYLHQKKKEKKTNKFW